MDDLIVTIEQKLKDLNYSIRQLRKTGAEFALAERDYKILLRTEALKLRDQGMPIGLINMTVYGIYEVADARQFRDIKEATYKANQEAINAIKLEIRVLDSQISREWNSHE